VFFGNDGELMSVKWKTYKAVFRYTEDSPRPAMESAYIKAQWPMMYDLSSDPHEDNNLFYTDLNNGWLFGPFFRLIGQYEASVKKYPNIKVGEDFKGYPAH
jgi:arylsulfatase